MLNFLKDKIGQAPNKRITYKEYMESALYDPIYGYYMKEKEKVGTRGDFLTTSSISSIFGRILARVFIGTVKSSDLPPVVIEIGGGNGSFAKAVLEEWEAVDPESFGDLVYYIAETSPYHRKLQRELIPDERKMVQAESVFDLPRPINGIIFSNELFDAFPVHVIEQREGSLFEVCVTFGEDGLQEVSIPLDDAGILEFLKENGITLIDGQRYEVPLDMKDYIIKLGSLVEKAAVFTVDYGYTREEWMEPGHREGSLRGYYQHQMIRDPLEHPGEMDLTTHIHFDALIQYGDSAGFEFVEKMRQDQFLLSAGILDYLQEHFDPNPFSEKSKQNRAIRSLIMDSGMSSAFHAIIQQKNIDVDWPGVLKKYQ